MASSCHRNETDTYHFNTQARTRSSWSEYPQVKLQMDLVEWQCTSRQIGMKCAVAGVVNEPLTASCTWPTPFRPTQSPLPSTTSGRSCKSFLQNERPSRG